MIVIVEEDVMLSVVCQVLQVWPSSELISPLPWTTSSDVRIALLHAVSKREAIIGKKLFQAIVHESIWVCGEGVDTLPRLG